MSAEFLLSGARVQFGTELSALLERRAHQLKRHEAENNNILASTSKSNAQKESRVLACPSCSSLWIPGVTCKVRSASHKRSPGTKNPKSGHNKKTKLHQKKYEEKLKAKLKDQFKPLVRNYLHYHCLSCPNGHTAIPSFTPLANEKSQVLSKKMEKPETINNKGSNAPSRKPASSNAKNTQKPPTVSPFGGGLNLQDFLL